MNVISNEDSRRLAEAIISLEHSNTKTFGICIFCSAVAPRLKGEPLHDDDCPVLLAREVMENE